MKQNTNKRPKTKEFEREFLISASSRIQNEVIKERLQYFFKWYTRKAETNKWRYNFYRTASYLLPCMITLVSVYSFLFKVNWVSIISATISVVLTFITHRSDHYRYYENWVRYRNTAENLKRHTELFLNRCTPYELESDIENERLLALTMEQLAEEELRNWESLHNESHQSFNRPFDQGHLVETSKIDKNK